MRTDGRTNRHDKQIVEFTVLRTRLTSATQTRIEPTFPDRQTHSLRNYRA